jgi:Diguanylate cyclase, GGDEF domain
VGWRTYLRACGVFDSLLGNYCCTANETPLVLLLLRPADLLGRFAGGRFALLFPETSAAGATTVAQHAIDAVDALQIEHAESTGRGHITLSVGGGRGDCPRSSTRSIDADSSAGAALVDSAPDDLIATAERALESAKSAGGHQARLDDIADSEALKQHLRATYDLSLGRSP